MRRVLLVLHTTHISPKQAKMTNLSLHYTAKLDKNDIAQAISIAEKMRIRILDWIKQELGGGTLANSKAIIQDAVLLQANTPTGQVHKKTLLLMSILRILRDNKTHTHVDLARQLGYRANHAVLCATIKKLTQYGLIHKVPYGYQIDSEFNFYHKVLS